MRMNFKKAIVLSTLAVFCISLSSIADAAKKAQPAPKPTQAAQQKQSQPTSAAKTPTTAPLGSPTTHPAGGGHRR